MVGGRGKSYAVSFVAVTGRHVSMHGCGGAGIRPRGLRGVLRTTRMTPATTGLRPIRLVTIRDRRNLTGVNGTTDVCRTPLTVVIYTSRGGT